jgi:hypothetical protein
MVSSGLKEGKKVKEGRLRKEGYDGSDRGGSGNGPW